MKSLMINFRWSASNTNRLLQIAFLSFLGIAIQDNYAQGLFNSIDLQDDVASGSHGGGWGDLNNDGYLDLYVSNGTAPNQNNFLYYNNSGGFFAPITTGIPVEDLRNDHANKSQGIGFGDFDNDAFLDIFIANTFQNSASDGNNSLFQNFGNGSFNAIGAGQTIVSDGKDAFGGSWGDYDNDGYLDLYVINGSTYQGSSETENFLFQNGQDGTFSMVSLEPITSDVARSRCANWVDYNNDGLLDLFVADNGLNALYKANKNQSSQIEFMRMPYDSVGSIATDSGNSITSSWGDFDNDGDLDLFVGNHSGQANLLYRNNGDGTFVRISGSPITTDIGNSTGSGWADFDNDGDLDLFVANDDFQRNFLYINGGSGADHSFSRYENKPDSIITDTFQSFGGYWGDYDLDGDLDLFVANAGSENSLYRNKASENGNHWINLNLVGTISNHSAIGAKVTASATIFGESFTQYREVSAQTGFGGQNSLNVEFGFGDATVIDEINILWPSGSHQTICNVDVDTFLTIEEADQGCNQPPIAHAGDNQTVECTGPSGANVTLDGSGSSDPDNDELTYTWRENGDVIAGPTTNPASEVSIELGNHEIELTVDDGNGGEEPDTVNIEVVDTTPPVIVLNGENPLTIIRFSGPFAEPGAMVTDLCDENPSLEVSGSVNPNLPGSYPITYTATDARDNTSEVVRMVHVIDDPNILSHPYLYLADKKIMLDKMDQSVGAMHSNDEVDLKKGPAVFEGNITALGKIDIAEYVTVVGDVTAGGELQLDDHVVIQGVASSNSTVTFVPLLEPSYSAGGNDVKVEQDETYELPAGSYGKVEVEEGGTLQLSSGHYFLEELVLKKDVNVEIHLSTGPANINVVKKVDMDEKVTMSLTPLGDGDSRYVTMNSLEDMQLGQESLLLGSFNAPHGKIQIKKGGFLIGSISAEEIDIDIDAASIFHGLQQPFKTPIASNQGHESEEEIVPVNRQHVPSEYALIQNYPNPFNPTTTISFAIPEPSEVSLVIYNGSGQIITELVSGPFAAGYHHLKWNGTDKSGLQVASGVYLYVLNVGYMTFKKKLTFLK